MKLLVLYTGLFFHDGTSSSMSLTITETPRAAMEPDMPSPILTRRLSVTLRSMPLDAFIESILLLLSSIISEPLSASTSSLDLSSITS